ncbi:uncharacterized protein N7515_003120 [Penicillium bovifimosum]|uniref:Subtelomeric hrmA-associated cluster protein AFUB-079030/YDR124W-like helical bundle domain-containing protein n=1 Tax=Penicillium bovifimosum TaxID=126998 RepID=A0A9W9H436_9EURO|nr:uncharacterized protein N7515_003120 [Penicillium bovifimosum]KAJ5138272.1 hypothetical protein N7515_003120 [Penicillium bovifimosum]
MSRQPPLAEGEYAHYAMIYLDRDGNLCQRASESIADSQQTILSPRVKSEFLRAVRMSTESQAAPYETPYDVTVPSRQEPQFKQPSPTQSQGGLVAYNGMCLNGEQSLQGPVLPNDTFQPPIWPQLNESWPHLQVTGSKPRKKNFGGQNLDLTSHQRASISVKDKELLRLYYEKAFQNLQQTNCRVIAKAYIKLVEPRKQVNYPYNGRKIVGGITRQLEPEATKPPWWPSGVSHREPDHLPKVERIRLLVHILCELRERYGVTTARLKECDQPIRRQILPVERLHILDEIYRVREEEQKLLDGVTGTPLIKPPLNARKLTHSLPTDGEQAVFISRTNLPQLAEDTLSGQSSPADPEPGPQNAGSECSDEFSGIDDLNRITPGDLSSASSYNINAPDLYSPTVHMPPEIQYQPVDPSTNRSTSPVKSKRKRESFAGTHLVDRTRPVDLAHYPYPADSTVPPIPMEYYATAPMPPNAGVPISHPSTESLSTEPMMPYAQPGQPYYFNY